MDIDGKKKTVFIDVDASQRFRQWKEGVAPALTRTRCRSGGWYLTTHGRRMASAQLLKLQGIHPDVFNVNGCGLSRSDLNAAVGNAMSANILERILPRVAYAAGILDQCPKDLWKDDAFVSSGARFSRPPAPHH